MDKQPCRICRGKQKTRCMICGWKAIGRKTEKKITDEEMARRRRMDFLGQIYNLMRKFRMDSTGYTGDYKGNRVVLCVGTDVPNGHLLILDAGEKLIVPDEWVTNIQENLIDNEIFNKIGNPMTGQEYIPFYKAKKNEVG